MRTVDVNLYHTLKKLFFNIFNDDDFSLPKAKDKIFVVLVFLLVQF
jgi:hypothetical protein